MKMACSNYVLAFILLAVCQINSVQLISGNGNQNNVQKACSVTRYQDLCIHSLASFSSSAKSSPSRWARAAVSVTLGEAKSVAQYLLALQKHSRINGRRSRVALSDCIECFQNAIDELHKSLGVLRSLSRKTFDTQMGDLNTWLSAALTNGDTCLDGFEGQRGRQVKLLQNKVLKATHITSNALALANKLAATGLESLPHS
ncbi:PREDICTED: 21 kDa [Prunus dulcis]|uniref:PREDICTED: 21 kDa n=2 Tax=Prunus dulcis TaxID=3755 RepID=A0A5E4FBB2_PRUDU|nr:pectinesterase inhibitor 6-like [Prunus dulcis]VVA25225.1 PREDICTED: 21 kDa [Prunus dulcis]